MTRLRPVANARMYSVTPEAREAWRALFAWASRASGVDLAVIDHAYPAPLAELWARPDLGAACMCGWPFARRVAEVTIIAAPVPAATGGPIYWTDLFVRADSPFRTLGDSFGSRLAFTAEDSQSGFNAVRRFLMPHARADGAPLYALVGPVITPRRALESVIAGEADVAPLDSYAHRLLAHYAPALTRQVRVIARTEPTPIPPLVASRAIARDAIDRLRVAFLSSRADPAARPLLDALLLDGFAEIEPAAYDITLAWAKEAEAAGRQRVA